MKWFFALLFSFMMSSAEAGLYEVRLSFSQNDIFELVNIETPRDEEEAVKERMRNPSIFFQGFITALGPVMESVKNSQELTKVANRFFHIFVVILIIQFAVKYAFGSGATMADLLFMILLIGITRVLMITYHDWTAAILNTGLFISDGLQEVIVGTSTSSWQMVTAVLNVFAAIAVTGSSFFTLGLTTLAVTTIIIAFKVFLALLAFYASAWGIWGVSVAQLIGWLFIPFLLFERLSFLFEGWLKFFLGFVFYIIIARINIALLNLALMSFMGVPVDRFGRFFFDDIGTFTLISDTFGNLFGLVGFMLIGILGVLSTGQFAMAIVGGAGGMAQGFRAVLMSTVIASLAYGKAAGALKSKLDQGSAGKLGGTRLRQNELGKRFLTRLKHNMQQQIKDIQKNGSLSKDAKTVQIGHLKKNIENIDKMIQTRKDLAAAKKAYNDLGNRRGPNGLTSGQREERFGLHMKIKKLENESEVYRGRIDTTMRAITDAKSDIANLGKVKRLDSEIKSLEKELARIDKAVGRQGEWRPVDIEKFNKTQERIEELKTERNLTEFLAEGNISDQTGVSLETNSRLEKGGMAEKMQNNELGYSKAVYHIGNLREEVEKLERDGQGLEVGSKEYLKNAESLKAAKSDLQQLEQYRDKIKSDPDMLYKPDDKKGK